MLLTDYTKVFVWLICFTDIGSSAIEYRMGVDHHQTVNLMKSTDDSPIRLKTYSLWLAIDALPELYDTFMCRTCQRDFSAMGCHILVHLSNIMINSMMGRDSYSLLRKITYL